MSQKFQVIGVSGKAGSGKDFISQNYLRPLGYKQISFAWHFKVGIVGEGKATHEEVFYTKPPHVRKVLQLKGTEEGRNIYGEDIWCNHTLEWMNVYNEAWGDTKFVIPDVRFPNEVKFVQQLGGKVLRINAPQRVANSSLSEEARQHISETALDDFTDFDAIIQNDPEHAESVEQQVKEALGMHVYPYDYSELLDSIFNDDIPTVISNIGKFIKG